MWFEAIKEFVVAQASAIAHDSVTAGKAIGNFAVATVENVAAALVYLATPFVEAGKAVVADPVGSAFIVKNNVIEFFINPFAYIAAHTVDPLVHPFGFVVTFMSIILGGLIVGLYIGKIARALLGQTFFLSRFGRPLKWAILLAGLGFGGYNAALAMAAMDSFHVAAPFAVFFGTISLVLKLGEEPVTVNLNAPAVAEQPVRAALPASPVAAQAVVAPVEPVAEKAEPVAIETEKKD